MTSEPRTMLHTSDLEPDDFGLLAGKVVSRTGLSGPFQLTEGTIADYVNQTGKPELVLAGGTESLPACCWIVFPDDTAVKIKVADPSGPGWCEEVVACVQSDLERGGGTQDKYVISDLAGPTWQIVGVTYGEDDTFVDFADDDGSDVITLMGALNDSEVLPESWHWSVVGGELVLSVPYGTGVTLVELPGGLEMEFTEPSVSGVEPSSLAVPMAEALAGPLDTIIAQYEALLDSYAGQLANTFGVGTATTEAGIETEFAANVKIEVRWTDADGDRRVSYKDPVNGWYHPVDKTFSSVVALTKQQVVLGDGSFLGALTIPAKVPTNAKFVKFYVKASSATLGHYANVIVRNASKACENETWSLGGTKGSSNSVFVLPKETEISYAGNLSGNSAEVTVRVFGWSR